MSGNRIVERNRKGKDPQYFGIPEIHIEKEGRQFRPVLGEIGALQALGVKRTRCPLRYKREFFTSCRRWDGMGFMNQSIPSSFVRWGILGAGNVCEKKAGPPLYKLPDSRLVLVHRRDRAAGEAFVQRHGHGRYVDNLGELLASPEIDAVYVASPHPLHAEHTIAALRAGKAVMVEKPMAMSTAECDEMIAVAEKTGRPLGVAYYRRGYPGIQRLKEELGKETIGEIHSAAINNEFPTSHRLDLVHWLFGEIEAMRTQPGSRSSHPFESTLDRFAVRTRSGVTVTMMTGWMETGMPEAIRVVGAKGVLALHDLKGGELNVMTEGQRESVDCGSLPHTHWGLFANFNRHLLAGDPLLCDGTEGRKSTVILDSLLKCKKPAKWVPVHYASEDRIPSPGD